MSRHVTPTAAPGDGEVQHANAVVAGLLDPCFCVSSRDTAAGVQSPRIRQKRDMGDMGHPALAYHISFYESLGVDICVDGCPCQGPVVL